MDAVINYVHDVDMGTVSHGPLKYLDEDRTFHSDVKGVIFIWKV